MKENVKSEETEEKLERIGIVREQASLQIYTGTGKKEKYIRGGTCNAYRGIKRFEKPRAPLHAISMF